MSDKPLFPDGPEKTAERLFNRPLSEEPPKNPVDPTTTLFNTVARFFAFYFAVIAVYVILLLAAVAGIGYIAWHFISKMW